MTNTDNSKDLYVYMLLSRNKDNKNIPNFKERCKTILAYESDEAKIYDKFFQFTNDGVENEISRLYKSVNRRDENKVREAFIIKLLKDKTSLTKINSALASAAQQKENALDNKWLFDFDEDDEWLRDQFIYDIEHNPSILNSSSPIEIKTHKTINGYAIIVNRGFDTRELMEKYKDYDITLKRDELLLLNWSQKL